jgi:hypothetical protein
MQAPHRMPLTEFVAELSRWAGLMGCPQCGGRLALAVCYVSWHSVEFGDLCAGAGRCDPLELPYCPACEQQPESSGCVHAPLDRQAAKAILS